MSCDVVLLGLLCPSFVVDLLIRKRKRMNYCKMKEEEKPMIPKGQNKLNRSNTTVLLCLFALYFVYYNANK